MNLETAIDHINYTDWQRHSKRSPAIAARYIDTDLGDYWNGPLNGLAELPAGYNADPSDKSTMSFRENFTGFWNMWKARIHHQGLRPARRDPPDRIKSAEEWLRREDRWDETRQGQPLGEGSAGELAPTRQS